MSLMGWAAASPHSTAKQSSLRFAPQPKKFSISDPPEHQPLDVEAIVVTVRGRSLARGGSLELVILIDLYWRILSRTAGPYFCQFQ
eukprot:2834195-Rhodomonas_salina.2